jgi:RHS repeat-associated protein
VEKKVSGNTTTVEYRYDAGGRRVQKIKGADTTRYVYDGLKVAIEQVNSNTPLLYFNDFSAVGGMLARYDGSSQEAKISRVYAYDVIGNVVGYLESDMPYGYGTGTSFVQEAFGNVLSGSQCGYHLTTKEYDSDSKLYYFKARWYDPEIGLFVRKDPTDYMYPYIYCDNNPINEIDPSGESPSELFGCHLTPEIVVGGFWLQLPPRFGFCVYDRGTAKPGSREEVLGIRVPSASYSPGDPCVIIFTPIGEQWVIPFVQWVRIRRVIICWLCGEVVLAKKFHYWRPTGEEYTKKEPTLRQVGSNCEEVMSEGEITGDFHCQARAPDGRITTRPIQR